jgi:hypothetical protein
MICQSIGLSPISTIGFGLRWDSSLSLVPKPPARITTFMIAPDKLTIHETESLLK